MVPWFKDKEKLEVLGLISGTSADGLDLALIRIQPNADKPTFTLRKFFTCKFPAEVQKRILDIAAPNGGNVEDVCQLNFFLGHLYSNIVLTYLEQENISAETIDCIGTHGQTICHLPQKTDWHGIRTASTLQVGDPSIIANRTGILTVGDFRVADIALAGEGAPLVPILDYIYFRTPQRNRIILNIGGISNFTHLPPNCLFQEVLAFDTGPGNVLIDSLAQKLLGIPYDPEGKNARSGSVKEELLNQLLQDEYFAMRPPKSTGRERFAAHVLDIILTYINEQDTSPQDSLATATELTARTIFEAYRNFVDPTSFPDELIVSGGGAANSYLMERLAHYFSATAIHCSTEFGLDSDAKEAICFAVMAYLTLQGFPSNLPSVTGAARPAVLGKICLP